MSHPYALATVFDPPADASVDEVRARLRALAELLVRAPVAIAVAHDAECRLISANDALAKLLGVPVDANISLVPRPGEPLPYRIQRDGVDLPLEELPMQSAMARRTHVSNMIDILRADGSVVHVRNDVEPLFDGSGSVCGSVSVCVDITEQKRAQDVLTEADRRKDDFLATLSHELRNPLAPIRNALQVMRGAADDPALAARALAIMERQVHQLVRLTDDLLDVSRITRNRIELRRETIDLRGVIRDALETTEPLVTAAAHHLSVDLPGSPMWVHADATRLAQALANILNNAVKYTDRGGHIAVSARADGGQAVITISDTGIGIDPSQLLRVFGMFVQIEPVGTRARTGLGIGLALARRLVELHGGSIEAGSAGADSGTTFVVRMALSETPAIAATEAEPVTPTLPRRVLVAEDIPDAAEMMRLVISGMGHEVQVAADGVQAVALAERFRPHIALLDIGMPRMDGYEAARRIRDGDPQVVLVALTGWGQEQDRQRAFDAGFNHHVTKPAEPDELASLIATAVDQR
jgi:signal transduction histidine kinase